MKNILYHVTPDENIDSILEHGLIPSGSFVSLSENPMGWLKDGMAILEVDVKDIGLEMHTFLPELDEITVWGRISPDRIRLIDMTKRK